jgi:phage shock protein PspC (stress-responsive transcriptional regulator)
MNYKKINDLTGWAVFGFALLVYLLTMAPTASFWDCGEFIACANELEVPHPPGAPFFLLVGRIFAMLSFGDVTLVPLMLNIQSALSSAFTVLFTFWITTIFARKLLVSPEAKPSREQILAIMGAGVVAGLANTFADSFWFNAVEAEVYAMSSFFTAIVVWLMLKWEARADEPGHQRWLILIMYLMGCSIGVHLLNLLTIPALAYIYYFRKYKFSWGGFLTTGIASVGILGLIQSGIIVYTFDIAWAFEKFLIGTQSASGATATGLGLPIGTGVVLTLILLFGGLVLGIWYSHKQKKVNLNTFLISILVVYMGFSSYAMIPIRSNANPPIDENNPENTLTFLSYMKREQYGNRPLVYGPMYNVRPIGYDRTKAYILEDGADRYTESGYKVEPKYPANRKKLFPRMYEPSRYDMGPHAYLNYVKRTGERNPRTGRDATPYDDQPTKGEDLKYFFGYQIKHMYWRYFMWNFAGRENDFQDCDWESGLEVWKTGKQTEPVKENPGKNHFYMLPFILGLIGLGWQAYKRGFDATIVGLLFFFTGFAIIIYLNQYPMQPRERDYSFAGSFQTYAIWIGLGVIALYEWLRKILGNKSLYAAIAIGLIPPILMGAQGWDDHTRAGRYIAPDSAWNLLNSLAPNAVLFTNGDNDTFPLWYLQEVENVRPDVRVLCLSYVNTDWYIDQMMMQMNESPALPLTLKPSEYVGQENQAMYLNQKTLNLRLPINKEELMEQGIITPKEAELIESGTMSWTVPTRSAGQQRYLELKDRVIINLVENSAKNGWDRPVYFANTVAPNSFIGLRDNLRLEGLAYRVMPIKYPRKQDRYDPYEGSVDPDRMYENLTKVFRYRNLDNDDVYYDENINRMVTNYHGVFYRLANYYLREAEKLEQPQSDTLAVPQELGSATPEALRERARELMTFTDEKFPYKVTNPDPYIMVRSGIMFDRLGMTEKSEEYLNEGYRIASGTLKYYAEVDDYFSKIDVYLYGMQMLAQFYAEKGDREKSNQIAQEAAQYDRKLRKYRGN